MRMFKRNAILQALTNGLSNQANNAPIGVPGTSAYWRVLATDKSWRAGMGDYFIGVKEISLFSSTDGTGTNLALGATASASSIYVAGTTDPSKAVDGDPATTWFSSSTATSPAWLQVQLSTPQALGSVRIDWKPSHSGNTPKSFAVQYSLNQGLTWITAGTGTTTSDSLTVDEYPSIVALTSIPDLGSIDPYIDYVTLLMHMDGANGSTLFYDEIGHQVTASGNAQISTAKTMVGVSEAYFDGSGDNLAVLPRPSFPNDFLFPGDFTIEGKAIFNAVGSSPQALFGFTNGAPTFDFRWYGGNDTWQVSLNAGSGTDISPTGVTNRPVVGVLCDIALVRINGVIKMYYKGKWTGVSINNSSTLGFANLTAYVAAVSLGGTNQANAYFDELRITNGIGRYSADYTPLVGKFPNPAVVGTGYVLGGQSITPTATYNVIDKMVFNTGVMTVSASTLDLTLMNSAGVASATKGYASGGYEGGSVVGNKIRAVTYATDAVALLAALLSSTRGYPTGFSSSVAGYVACGTITSSTNRSQTIDKLLFSTEACTTLAATLAVKTCNATGLNSALKGYQVGGYQGSTVNAIDSMTFASEARTAVAATLSGTRQSQGGVSAVIAGYVGGGWYGSTSTSAIEKLLFSTDTRTMTSAALSTALCDIAGLQSKAEGYFCGGGSKSAANSVLTAALTALPFATEAAYTHSAHLGTARQGASGVSSK